MLTLSILGAMAFYLAWGTYRCMKTELPDLEEEKGYNPAKLEMDRAIEGFKN